MVFFSELVENVCGARSASMKLTSQSSRRAFIKSSALGVGALGMISAAPENALAAAAPSNTAAPASDIAVWYTNGKQRFAAGQPIPWHTAATSASLESVQLALANKFQDILGFGGCFT